MSYYAEHGAHYINVSEYRIARYVKCLSSAVISLKHARMHACISVCVCVCMDVCVLFCRLYTRT